MSLVIFDGLYGEDEYVDLRTNQQVGGIKTFIDALISMAGPDAITIRPLVGQGESSMRFQRMSDGTNPTAWRQLGHWPGPLEQCPEFRHR